MKKWWGILLVGWSMAIVPVATADVVYQAFNERFVTIADQADEIAAAGYKYVQISPPTKSIDETIWWGRYQPVDYRVIEGPLGDERQLRDMIATLNGRGLKVIVDVVLNHMADPVFYPHNLHYPEFSPQDFHHADWRPCIVNWDNRTEVTEYWLCDPAFPDRRLPDLNTQSPYVRQIHKNFLSRMIALGIDGFRIDAVKHIEPEYFAEVLSVIPEDKFVYGEVIGRGLWEAELYTPYMKVSDFQLLSVMLGAFSIGGSLVDLVDPESYGAALPASRAVVFARNHDTAMHDGFFNFGDHHDALLATAFVVARGVGVPVVYRDDAFARVVTQAVAFHDAMAGRSTYVRTADELCNVGSGGCARDTFLAVQRGDNGLMLLNKANDWLDVATARMPGMSSGCYRESMYDFYMQVAPGGDGQQWVKAWGSTARGGIAMGPRSAMFFEKTDASHCINAFR